MDCECRICRTACSHRPGWFMPGEVAKAAALLGMTEQEFFDKYIGVDWWERKVPLFVLAPAIKHCTPGSEYPFDPIGECVFLKEGRCSIHGAKPHECSFYDHTKSEATCAEERQRIVEAWESNQEEIERLLGRAPHRPEPDVVDMFGLLNSKTKWNSVQHDS